MLQRLDCGWLVLICSRLSCAAIAASGSTCVSREARRSPQVQACSVQRTIRNEGPCGGGTDLMHFTLESVRLTLQLFARVQVATFWGEPR